MFVLLEGLDGCGKTTQRRALERRLRERGLDPVIVREPGGTPVGERIRQILLLEKDLTMAPLTELLLYEAARSELTRTVIKPALAAGRWVLADRYALASLAYQGYGRGIRLDLVRKLNRLATEGLEPDLTVVLDIPVELALQRKGQARDRLEGSGVGFYERVRTGYVELIRQIPGGVLLDATGDVTAIAEQIWTHLRPLLERTTVTAQP